MATVVPSQAAPPANEAEIREKTWQGMMTVGRFAGVALLFIAVARYFAVLQLQGKSVIDVTTVGAFGLGLFTLLVTSIAPPLPTPRAPSKASETKKKID